MSDLQSMTNISNPVNDSVTEFKSVKLAAKKPFVAGSEEHIDWLVQQETEGKKLFGPDLIG